MRKLGFVAVILLIIGASSPALACRIIPRIILDDVSYADTVVVGSISNYRIIRDEAFRQQMLSMPNLSPVLRENYEGGGSLLSDYARFDIEVAEVLVGTAPSHISATWDNSTFNEPEHIPAGPFLIALRGPSSAVPFIRGPSATIDLSLPTILQAPCARPFVIKADSDEAAEIRRILERQAR